VQGLMACGVVPLRQQHDQVWVEDLIFKGVDALDDLLLLEVNDRDRAVAHAGRLRRLFCTKAYRPSLVNATWWAPGAAGIDFRSLGCFGSLPTSKMI